MIGELLTSLISATVGSAATHAWAKARSRRRAAGQIALLSGLDDPLFVFPPREGPPEKVLLQVAIEDFMAINNMISAFILAGRQAQIRVRDAPNLTAHDKENNNLVLICSTTTNPVTSEALARLRAGRPPDQRELIPVFVKGASPEQAHINW
ncbi:MAG TPA: hypothetical protein VM243_03695, partial [Phycisphaerae bacterium]|nr:hypothetical protein [Phycisphaerae bacterium]